MTNTPVTFTSKWNWYCMNYDCVFCPCRRGTMCFYEDRERCEKELEEDLNEGTKI